MTDLLMEILQAVVAVVIPIVSGYAVKYLNANASLVKEKANSELIERYIDNLETAVSDAVLYTSQTYVDALKGSDKWTTENQKTALSIAVDKAKELLTADSAKFLNSAYADLSSLLTAKIEAEINSSRPN